MQLPYRKPGKYSQTETDYYISQNKFDELYKILAKLKKVRPSAALEVSRLAELGDFSENVEYQLAKRRLRGINTKMLYIENDLNRAIIISPDKKSKIIQIGHTVTLENLENNNKIIYKILGSKETDPKNNIISYSSPIGLALVGKKLNQEVTINLPKQDIKYKIKKISV
jgi:transcription elongation factor GreA